VRLSVPEPLRLALDASRTGLCLFGDDGSPHFLNPAFVRLLGFAAAGDVSWKTFAARLGRSAAPGEELAFWASDRYVHVRLAAADTGELLASVDDVTGQERERERASRDRFMAEVVAAQEREARRISELLHDNAVQRLTALALQLELAAQDGGDEVLAAAATAANEITASLRRLVVELHPAVLESQGLSAAIEASAESLRAHGVEVDVEYLEHRLPAETELIVYRLVQEALANALKHARARRVEVGLSLRDKTLRGRVSDDGTGFATERMKTAVREGHLGLHLVRERVEMGGGRFLLESDPGSGTTFSFELPLMAAATKPAAEGAG
jgi:signal transduction histidine kinase